MFKSRIQILLLLIGLVALGLGIKTMLQAPTLILTPEFLVVLYTPILIGLSLALGFGIKKGLNSSWHTLTFSAIIVTLICGIFYLTQHRSTEHIEILPEYKGQVYLLVSNEQQNDFQINEQGIGYITEQSIKKGFMPTVIQGETDITGLISGYAYGSATFNYNGQSGSVEFVRFEVPGRLERWNSPSINELLKNGAIDSTRIKVK